MICTKCGHNNVNEARFCEECGNMLSGGAPAPQQPVYTPPQQNYSQPYAQPSFAPQPEKKGVGFAVTSMVCGILSLVLSCCIPYVPFILALVGLVLGAVSLHGHRGGKGMAIAGLVMSIISLIPAVIVIIMGASLFAALGL
ncbi:MAG: DUF4190 domain-containing protein [Lachnospiraceae bacterium]|jgi:amino acid transporter|nr:DUF4190 domain-containing protein [Lachnospiraceae bacterium]